jgi:malate permease and related proteins
VQNINLVFIQTLLIISLGYALKHFKVLNLEAGKNISKLLMYTTFPALMLVSTSRVKLESSYFLLTILCIAYIAIMLSLAFFWFKSYDTKLRGVLTLGAGGFNVGLFGFPLIESLFGKQALVYAVMFDIGNTLMVFIATYGLGFYIANKGQKAFKFKDVLIKIASLPPFLAMCIGLFINLCHLKISDQAYNFLEILASANKPLVLLLMGIYLKINLSKKYRIAIIKVLTLRYSVAIFVIFFLFLILKNQPETLNILTICALLPLGLTILPFSDELGFDSEIAGSILNFSLIISFFLMWFFMSFFKFNY